MSFCSHEEDEYVYPSDSDDSVGDAPEGGDGMEWDPTTGGENPNAAPTGVDAGLVFSGIRMFPSEELLPEMTRRIGEVTEVLGIPASAAAVLLRGHKWSKEALMEAFCIDQEATLKKFGVYARCNPPKEKMETASTCQICYDDDVDEMRAMPCGHEYCTECWVEFCGNAVDEGPACVRTTCPQAGCPEVMTEVEVGAALGGDSKKLAKYLSYQLRSFVESHRLTRWCPGNGCEKVACAQSTSAMEREDNLARCDDCMISFCMICGEEPHAPCGCKELGLWNEKCRNESETANWVLANTKSCPKCGVRIEKNQGCNHMQCQRCRHAFCWICLGSDCGHGGCTRYNPDGPGAEDQSDVAKAKRELDRYLHYYKRHHAHDEAQKYANRQWKETTARMVWLQELQKTKHEENYSDFDFLKKANEQLVDCRRVLKYTYVFAYYLTADGEQSMLRERFEHHQEMLERFTENLSALSEKPLAKIDRTDVVNQTRLVGRFIKNILESVEDGEE